MDNSAHNTAQMSRYALSRNLQSAKATVADLRRPKGEREAALRDVRRYERELGVVGSSYNG